MDARLPDPRMIPVWHVPPPLPLPASPPEPAELGAWGTPKAEADGGQSPGESTDDEVLVRPFLLTGGRTRPLCDGLRVETLVSAPPAALSAPLRFELRMIVEYCQAPHSIAEIGARFGIPLGVAKALVGDLVSGGVVRCAEPAELSIEMIERIRDRVRAL